MQIHLKISTIYENMTQPLSRWLRQIEKLHNHHNHQCEKKIKVVHVKVNC